MAQRVCTQAEARALLEGLKREYGLIPAASVKARVREIVREERESMGAMEGIVVEKCKYCTGGYVRSTAEHKMFCRQVCEDAWVRATLKRLTVQDCIELVEHVAYELSSHHGGPGRKYTTVEELEARRQERLQYMRDRRRAIAAQV